MGDDRLPHTGTLVGMVQGPSTDVNREAQQKDIVLRFINSCSAGTNDTWPGNQKVDGREVGGVGTAHPHSSS